MTYRPEVPGIMLQLPDSFAFPEAPSVDATARRHELAIQEYGINLAGHADLGTALAKFRPVTELIIRGRYGLYPFDEPQRTRALADRLSMTWQSVGKSHRKTHKALQDGVYPKNYGASGGISYETLAGLVAAGTYVVDEPDLLFLLELRGMPPFAAPIAVEDMALRHHIVASTVLKRANRIADRLLYPGKPAVKMGRPRSRAVPEFDAQPARNKPISHSTDATQKPSPPKLSPAERKQRLHRQLQVRDAGIYASVVCNLIPEETRDSWLHILRHDLARAATLREYRRIRLKNQEKRPLAFMNDKHATPVDNSLLDAKREFTDELDTAAGHEELLGRLVLHAEKCTPQAIPELQTVIDDGKEAVRQIIAENVSLVFFTTGKIAGRKGFATMRDELLSAGFEGLREAARRFDGEVGKAFSSYATKMIGGYVMREVTAEAAKTYGIKVSELNMIDRMLAARRNIIKKYAGIPENIDELIADKLGRSVASLQYYKDMWRDIHDENPEATARKTVQDTLENTEKSVAIQSALSDVFKALEVHEDDARILFLLHGIGSDQLSEKQVAEQLELSEADVRKRARKIKRIISQSPQAQKMLLGFILTDDYAQPK